MDDQQPKAAQPDDGDELDRPFSRPRLRLGAALAVAIGAGIGAWAVVGSNDPGRSAAAAAPATTATAVAVVGPVALSATALRTFTASAAGPVYWAGPKAGYRYELTRTSAGAVFVRYLPAGAAVGAKGQNYLVVATYPFPDALAALERLPGPHLALPGKGVALVDQGHPQSVHIAFPGVQNQVEIFDPVPARSLRVARSGDVRPVSP